VSLRETRADVIKLVDDTAALRSRLLELLRMFQRRRRPSKAAKIGAGALTLLSVGAAVLGARAVLHGRKVKRALLSPVRRRLRMALAAGVASLIARRLARRALAP
jgi:hypothetical protein